MSVHVNIASYTNDCFRVMYELRKKCLLCDVVLCVGCYEFSAHRVVLAGASPYLRAMFTNGMLESEKTKIELRGIDPQIMESLLEFLYTGSLELNTSNVQKLLSAASMLHLNTLAKSCSAFLEAHLDNTNCLGIYNFANVYCLTHLEQVAFNYICEHFLDVVKSDEFLELDKAGIIDLLKCTGLQVYSEDDVFNAVELWIYHSYEERKFDAANILQYVRLPLISLEFLELRVVPCSFMKDDGECQRLLATALNDNSPAYMTLPRALPQTLYTVGGRNSNSCQLPTLEQFDKSGNSWSMLKPMTCARTAVGAGSLNGYLYVIGGECATDTSNLPGETNYKKTVEVYKPQDKTWFTVADLNIPRSFVSVVSYDSYIYALGGEDRLCSYNFVERYDPRGNYWTPVQSMKRRRSGAGAAVCNGLIYVAGGYDRGIHTDRASVECYDPELDQWMFVTELEKARSGLGLVSLNGCLYAVGGRNRSTDSYFDLVECYNPHTRLWSPVAPMNSPRAWASVVVYKNSIFAIGGFDGAHRLNTVEKYDTTRNVWSNVQGLNVSRAGCGAAVL